MYDIYSKSPDDIRTNTFWKIFWQSSGLICHADFHSKSRIVENNLVMYLLIIVIPKLAPVSIQYSTWPGYQNSYHHICVKSEYLRVSVRIPLLAGSTLLKRSEYLQNLQFDFV